LQEAPVRAFIAAAIFGFFLAAFCSPLGAQTSKPTFLFLLEGKGVPIGTIHVFSVNPSTGAITEVPGSPFNAGLIPEILVVDPTGRFLYVANSESQDITAFSIDSATGTLTGLPGSPFPIAATPITAAVDPTGRFLYVFATNLINNVEQEFLYEYTIDSVTGVLTAASSSPTTWEFRPGYAIVSIAFDLAGNYAYLGQVAGGNVGAPTLVCAVDLHSGTLTQIRSVQPATNGEASHIAVSPNGGFLYSINSTFSRADAFTIGSGGGSLTEIPGSPYPVPYGPSSLVLHPSGNFLYIANSNSTFQAPPATGPIVGSIYGFSIDSGTGALTQVSGSPYAAGIDPVSIVVDPTGNFAYWTTTANTTGTPFARIMGYSINATSGVLTPLSLTPWTDLAPSNGAQLAISSGPLSTPNPAPMISSLSPASAVANAVAFTLQVNGASFAPGATVYFGGQPRSTTFVSSTRLIASILATDIDNDGTVAVFVFNPLPGGGASTSVEFPVSALSPVISSIIPSSVILGRVPFTLVVIGSNFVVSSVINFNGIPQTTTYSSPTEITTPIPITEIATAGTAAISVTTPSNGVPGGGTSNTVLLTILPPETQPMVASISPSSAPGGGPAFTLVVNGSGFVSGSQVGFNMTNVTTILVSPTQLTASIPASAVASVGYTSVIVTNPGGLVSVPMLFTVFNPPPGGGSVSPPSLPAGSNALTLSVIGTGFTPSSVVLVNGNSRVPTYKSSTLLLATLMPSDLAQGGTLNITVTNPPPGGGTTGVISFTVADYSVTPPSASPPVTAGQTANFLLTLLPSNGTFSDPVTFNVSPLPAGATASFAPSATITPGATKQTVTLAITTAPHIAASTVNFPHGSHLALPVLFLAGMAFVLAGFCLLASGGRVHRLVPQLLLALLLVAAVGLAACSAVGTGPSSPPQLNPAAGTPAGTYPMIVTATSGAVSHTTTVTLTVM
jgi:DNA-binding beta-propeller fold protein YncE